MQTDLLIVKTASWIQEYLRSTGKEKVVIGMSGGIDSAVVFELLIRAIGKRNVIPVTIPILASTDEEYSTATDIWSYVFEKRGIELITLPASGLAINSGSLIRGGIGKHPSQMTYANIQARLRMLLLYGVASENDALVIGTGNRSEHLMGYFTKYGDGGTDFEPIMSLYKSEVFELGRALNVPKWILNAAPSAGLWKGQTDEEEFGFTYDQLEIVCRVLFDGMVAEGMFDIPPDIIEKIKMLYRNNLHKTKMPPLFYIERGQTGELDI